MIVVTVVATKGGVGKTTIAANLGGLLRDLGLRVLLIDADVQSSLSLYFKIKDAARKGLTTRRTAVIDRAAEHNPKERAVSKASGKVIALHRASPSSRSEPSLRQQAMMLEWFGADTISFNRAFVDMTGSVLSALWLSWVLDQMTQFKREGRGWTQDSLFTFRMTGEECERSTGITRAQQTTCRKQLTEAGLITESEAGGRGKTVLYTVHLDRLFARLEAVSAPLRQALELEQSFTPERQAAGG